MEQMATTTYWWAICYACDWSGPDEPTCGAAFRDAEEHAVEEQHDTRVKHDTSEAHKFAHWHTDEAERAECIACNPIT